MFDICPLRARSRTLYDPALEKITAERHSVMSVDLDSIATNGLPRNYHVFASFCLIVYLTMRTVSSALDGCGRLAAVSVCEDPESFPMDTQGS